MGLQIVAALIAAALVNGDFSARRLPLRFDTGQTLTEENLSGDEKMILIALCLRDFVRDQRSFGEALLKDGIRRIAN